MLGVTPESQWSNQATLRQAWQGMFICLIALWMLKATLKESKDYIFVDENRRTDFGRCDCEQFWKMLNDLLQQAQWSFAPERQFWSLEVHSVRSNPSSLQQNYQIHCVSTLSTIHISVSLRGWGCPIHWQTDLIFLWLFAKGKFNKIN